MIESLPYLTYKEDDEEYKITTYSGCVPHLYRKGNLWRVEWFDYINNWSLIYFEGNTPYDVVNEAYNFCNEYNLI